MAVTLLNPEVHDHFFSDQATKFGVWATGTVTGQFWYLERHQEIVAHMNEEADQFYVVLQGQGEFRTLDVATVNPTFLYRPHPTQVVAPSPKLAAAEGLTAQRGTMSAGQVFVAPAKTLHAINNMGTARMVIFATGAPAGHRAIYTSR